MKRAEQPPNTTFGSDADLRELGTLLETRIEILAVWAADDNFWEDR